MKTQVNKIKGERGRQNKKNIVESATPLSIIYLFIYLFISERLAKEFSNNTNFFQVCNANKRHKK